MQHLVPVAKAAIAVSPQHDAQRLGRGREEVPLMGGGGGGGVAGGGMQCNDKDLMHVVLMPTTNVKLTSHYPDLAARPVSGVKN